MRALEVNSNSDRNEHCHLHMHTAHQGESVSRSNRQTSINVRGSILTRSERVNNNHFGTRRVKQACSACCDFSGTVFHILELVTELNRSMLNQMPKLNLNADKLS